MTKTANKMYFCSWCKTLHNADQECLNEIRFAVKELLDWLDESGEIIDRMGYISTVRRLVEDKDEEDD